MYCGFNEEGDKCPTVECSGVLAFEKVTNCSCHIAPPCSQCTERVLECKQCGWQDTNEPDEKVVHCGGGIGIVEYKPRPLDNTKIDYATKMHTASSQLVEGVYPDGTSQDDVYKVVKGTFGGRFEAFSGGRFKFIAYTD